MSSISKFPKLTDAGKGLLICALSGSTINFTRIKIGNGSSLKEPEAGDYWYNIESNKLNRYIEQWEESQRNITAAEAPPAAASEGDLWYNTGDKKLYWYSTEWKLSYDENLWYDTSTEKLMVYVTEWVTDTEKVFTYGREAPAAPAAGNWWYNSGQNQLYEYNGQMWNPSGATITCSTSKPLTQNTLTDLVNPLIDITINGISKGADYVSLTGTFGNSDVSEDFNWTETGIFAEDEDGNEHLYAYCHTGEQYETIYANTAGRPLSVTLTILVMVGDAKEVTASVGEGSVYATRESLEDHKRDTSNPHKVTKDQIGLGNVENVSPADMVIEYEQASDISEPKSGEKMSTFLGKVKIAINNLILHLKANNPHKITPKKINAAEESHKHNADDITSGTLNPKYGGTGVTSLKSLSEQLSSSLIVVGEYTGNNQSYREISLGFYPRAVLLFDSNGRVTEKYRTAVEDQCVYYGGLALRGSPIRKTHGSTVCTVLAVTQNGFAVGYNDSSVNSTETMMVYTNRSGLSYRYIAIR